jgi:hypothetical protein
MFIKRENKDILVVQVYVDDLVFGATSQKLVDEFTLLMKKEFEMSMEGDLNYFLGLKITQT